MQLRVEIRAMNHGERMNLSTRRDAIEIVKEGEHKGGGWGWGWGGGGLIVVIFCVR